MPLCTSWNGWNLKHGAHQVLVRMWQNWDSHCWWEWKMVSVLWETIWQFLKEVNVYLPYNPAVPLLGIQLRKMKAEVHIEACIYLFTPTLSRIFKNWNTRLSIHRWVGRHTVLCSYIWYSATGENQPVVCPTTWINLKLCQVKILYQKGVPSCMIPFVYDYKKM